jgi:transposase
MAAWNQKRRDPLTLEERRKNAIQLLLAKDDSDDQDSLSQADVARKFGVTRGVVSQWLEAYKKARNSLEGLDAREHTGRPPQMTRRQKRRLVRIVEKGAEQYGFETDIWTTERIARVVEEQFQIKYHRDHVRKIIHALNLSWQKPKKIARERDEDQVRNWVENVLPEIKKN